MDIVSDDGAELAAAGAESGSLAVETAGVAADGVSVEITAADGAPDDPPDTQ